MMYYKWDNLELGTSGSTSTKDKWKAGAWMLVGGQFAQDTRSQVPGSDRTLYENAVGTVTCEGDVTVDTHRIYVSWRGGGMILRLIHDVSLLPL
jgi:hypothetical protein